MSPRQVASLQGDYKEACEYRDAARAETREAEVTHPSSLNQTTPHHR